MVTGMTTSRDVARHEEKGHDMVRQDVLVFIKNQAWWIDSIERHMWARKDGGSCYERSLVTSDIWYIEFKWLGIYRKGGQVGTRIQRYVLFD